MQIVKQVELRNDQDSSALVRKLNALVHMSSEEIDFLEGLQINNTDLQAGEQIVSEGDEFRSTYILRSGWAHRYRVLEDGRRQIMSYILPGDIIGLNVNFRRTANYSVEARTKVALALVEPMRVIEIQQKYPILASALSWVTVREYAILAEQVVRLGRRTAYERMIHLFLELHRRLDLVGLADTQAFRLPLTQQDLADTLGLSVVHVNRTIKRLRADGLIAGDNDVVALNDIQRLEEIADNPVAFLEDFVIL